MFPSPLTGSRKGCISSDGGSFRNKELNPVFVADSAALLENKLGKRNLERCFCLRLKESLWQVVSPQLQARVLGGLATHGSRSSPLKGTPGCCGSSSLYGWVSDDWDSVWGPGCLIDIADGTYHRDVSSRIPSNDGLGAYE